MYKQKQRLKKRNPVYTNDKAIKEKGSVELILRSSTEPFLREKRYQLVFQLEEKNIFMKKILIGYCCLL